MFIVSVCSAPPLILFLASLMGFPVQESTDQSVHTQTHRLGFHFRERIVDQARESLLASGKMVSPKITSGQPESTPKDRNQIFKEADAVLRDLFPRIPNSNRMDILRHSFDKVCPSVLTS